jgi:hypothetical protein
MIVAATAMTPPTRTASKKTTAHIGGSPIMREG